MRGVLAFFGNLSPWELILVLVIAILVFGRRLPQVAAQGAHQLVKFRRTLSSMWRETGLSEEWNNLQREVDGVRRFDPLRGEPPRKRETWEQPTLPPASNPGSDPAREPAAAPWTAYQQGPVAEEARSVGASDAPAASEHSSDARESNGDAADEPGTRP